MTDGPDDDFGALLEASLGKAQRRLTVGARVRGTVMQVGQERLVLDLGDGYDGLLELRELGEADERPEVKEGDIVEAYVQRVEDRVAELGMKAGGRAGGAGRAQLEQAHATGLPVEGVVAEVNKGGYVVEAAGARAFCPLGSMDMRRIEDPTTMIGRKLLFRVTEMKGPRDVVLSRRVLLEEDSARKAAETREKLKVGARMRGTIVSVRDFGAFVDLGGIDGMIPVGEMAFGRTRAGDAVKEGDSVDVEVLRMEPGKDGRERITLSMKALLDDPFHDTAATLTAGLVVAGTVTRVQPFGAFVELAPGVEGLLHVSAFGRRIGHPADIVKPGDAVAVRIEGVDAESRRIGLHYADQDDLSLEGDTSSQGIRILRHAEAPRERAVITGPTERPTAPRESTAPRMPAARVGDIVDATVDRVEPYGLFLSWAGGRGLMPEREMGLPRGADLRRQFKAGATMKAAIIGIREDGKISLSKIAVERAEERAETDAYMKTAAPPPTGGFGSLGDLMKLKKGR